MYLRVIDYFAAIQRCSAIEVVTDARSSNWLRESIQVIEDLLARVREINQGERSSEFEEDCRAKLDLIYGEHNRALQLWDSMLSRKDVYLPPVRRQIVWAYLSRKERKWSNLTTRELERTSRLLEENLSEEPNNEKNLRLWLQAIRVLANSPSLESVIERLTYWRANSDSLESLYYLFIMHSLKAFEGSTFARDHANRCLEECRSRTRYRRNRKKSFEWLGKGDGLGKLVHHEALGEWNRDSQFWKDPSPLQRVSGIISRIQGPEAGEIETEGGLKAFFVPIRSQHFKGNSENRRITCFIGFSYDGLRAWSVSDGQDP